MSKDITSEAQIVAAPSEDILRRIRKEERRKSCSARRIRRELKEARKPFRVSLGELNKPVKP